MPGSPVPSLTTPLLKEAKALSSKKVELALVSNLKELVKTQKERSGEDVFKTDPTLLFEIINTSVNNLPAAKKMCDKALDKQALSNDLKYVYSYSCCNSPDNSTIEESLLKLAEDLESPVSAPISRLITG